MKLYDKAKALFASVKPRERSTSTVTHDRIDEGIVDDFRERATVFDNIFQQAPSVPVGELPEKCYSCGNESPDWQIANGKATCPACHTDAQMPEAPYSAWGDLVRDVFYANFTYDEPRAKASEAVDPSREVNRRIMQRYVTSDELLDTRPITRLNEFEAAFTAASFANGIHQSIREGSLSAHAKRAEDMAQYERTLDDIQSKLDQLREQVDDPDQIDDALVQQIESLTDAHQQATDALAGLKDAAESDPLGADVGAAIDAAAQQSQEEASAIASMPGTNAGAGMRIAPDTMFALAQQWRENAILRRVAEIMGRLERDMRYQRANRVVGGFEEVVDVETGDNAHQALPYELSKLHHPVLRRDFFRRYHEQAIAQYELRGNEPQGKGPVVILVDGSYSMYGDRNAWAKAVCLALVNIAHKEKRDACVIEFGSEGQHRPWFFEGRQPLDIEQVIDCASHFFGGGTDITSAALAGEAVMLNVPQFNKADMVVISDGESYWTETGSNLRDRLQQRSVRIHGVGIGGVYGYLSKFCESNIHVSDLALDGANEATTHLATAIT